MDQWPWRWSLINWSLYVSSPRLSLPWTQYSLPLHILVSGDDIYTTLLLGMLLGFFFLILPFYFMRTPRPAAFFSDTQTHAKHWIVNLALYSRKSFLSWCITETKLKVGTLVGPGCVWRLYAALLRTSPMVHSEFGPHQRIRKTKNLSL